MNGNPNIINVNISLFVTISRKHFLTDHQGTLRILRGIRNNMGYVLLNASENIKYKQ